MSRIGPEYIDVAVPDRLVAGGALLRHEPEEEEDEEEEDRDDREDGDDEDEEGDDGYSE